jgi:hypothetical protein
MPLGPEIGLRSTLFSELKCTFYSQGRKHLTDIWKLRFKKVVERKITKEIENRIYYSKYKVNNFEISL